MAFTEYVYGWTPGRHHRRWLTASQQHDRIVVMAAVDHGKSSTFSRAIPIWTLGRNPDARIAIISETATQASRLLGAVREDILRNPRLRAVFPNLKPASGAREKWTDTEVVVERPSQVKDPSIQAIGVMGPLLGARLDLAILDDTCSWENTLTEGQRQKLVAWFKSTLVGRMVALGKVIVCGTPWHVNDLLHELERSGEYFVIRDPAVDPGTGEALWPEVWSPERLEQRRREVGEREWSRQFLVRVLPDDSSRFKLDWVEAASATAAREGATLVDEYIGLGRTFSGVDLGVGLSAHHDETAIFTIALLPDGRRRVLAIEAGRWTAPEIIERIKATHRRYRSVVRVETNGAQGHILGFLQQDGIRVEAHTTGRNKYDPIYGIEGIAIELEAGRWVVPDAPATRAWARELLNYNANAHSGDRLVASWLAVEAARSASKTELFPAPFLRSNDQFGFVDGHAVVTRDVEDGFPAGSWMPFLR